MPVYFINGKILLITTYKETDKLQNRCISLPIATVTISVHHTGSVANQACAHDVYLLCVACIH